MTGCSSRTRGCIRLPLCDACCVPDDANFDLAYMRISLFSLVLILLVGCKPQALETQVSVVQKAALGVASSARPSSPTSGPATDIQSRLVKRYAATYDYDSLISEPELKLKLQELLDSDYQRFAENMSHMKFPVDVISGNLSVVGRRKKDEYSWDEAVLCVSFHPLAVHVGMYSDSQMVIYSNQPQ